MNRPDLLSGSADILARLRADAERIFRSAAAAADPYRAIQRCLSIKSGTEALSVTAQPRADLHLSLAGFDRILVVGAGKAVVAMASAVEDLLGARVTEGCLITKYGFGAETRRCTVFEAGHPIPDRAGEAATRRLLALLDQTDDRDLVIALISGGASALLVQPAPGLGLTHKQKVTSALLACGATIDEINTVRKHLSACKGGQFARRVFPATVLNLLLSDVVGDRPDVIGSGPFVPDPSTYADACAVLERYGLSDSHPEVAAHLAAGARGCLVETPKPGDPLFTRVHTLIVGNNFLALDAARAEAQRLGYKPLILSSRIEGETRVVARMHTAIAAEILSVGHPLSPPACILSGGETTVTVRGTGRGGRNQEFCLAAALELLRLPPRIVVLSGATDGNDGPTDAAGGIVDGGTVGRALAKGMDAADCLADNDSYTLLDQSGDLLRTGPTGTNVM
ncbi:MAG: glycerate kinase type-2 family protein, partial [Kiritimatiellia bacterium]